MSEVILVPIVKPHAKQKELLDNRNRFNVLKCGRRFGKTELAQILLKEVIKKVHTGAYFAPTYKDLYEVWNETKRVFHDIIETKNETVKQLILIGGAKIDFWSMDDPDSGRGRKYHRVIIDECEKASKFQQAWEETIRATLTDYSGDAYFLSTPKFGDTFFKQLSNYEKPDWTSFVYTTYDNPYINPDEVKKAQELLDPAVFDCEYLAKDLDGRAINPFAHQFDYDCHVSKRAIHFPQKRIVIAVDFNLNPFAVTFSHIWQDRDGYHHYVFDEAFIDNGSIPAMIDLIRERYGSVLHICELTGDAMGKNRDISRRDNASLYNQLRDGLRISDNQVKVYPNPTHENSRSDVNWVLYHAKSEHEFIINPDKCPGTVRDFRYVQCDSFGHILKRDRKDLNQRADFLDTIRYSINVYWRDIISK